MSVQEQSHVERRDREDADATSLGAGTPPNKSEKRPLRVALVASSYNYIKDGVALTLNRLVAYLTRQGVEVLVFAPVGEVPAFVHEGTLVPVPSVQVPQRPEYRLALGLGRHATERLRAFEPDIMHIALAPDFLGYGALREARIWRAWARARYSGRDGSFAAASE